MGNKNKQIDRDVNDIHTNLVKSSLVLREKLKEVQNELKDWKSGLFDEDNGENPSMH